MQNVKRAAIAAFLLFCAVGVGALVTRACSSEKRGFIPINLINTSPSTSFVGVVDPGDSSWGGLTSCTSGCSSGAADANRASIQATISHVGASANRRTLYIRPGTYPVTCTPAASYVFDFSGLTNVDIDARNVTLRLQGNLGSSDCNILWLRNTSGVKITGLTLSQRDATSATTSTNMILIGDGGTTSTDDITLSDVAFIEGVGGDAVRMSGGTSALTVTRVRVVDGSRFEGAARDGINVRPGVERVTIEHDYFRSNAGRDIRFEDTGDGVIGQSTIQYNIIETDKSTPAVTLAGHGGAHVADQILFDANRVIAPVAATTGGGTIEASNLWNATISHNEIDTNRSTSDPSIFLTGSISGVIVTDNNVDRRGGASNASPIKVTDDGVNSPRLVTVKGNRIRQYSGIAPGIDVSGCERCIVEKNIETYHAATADSGDTGFSGVYCSGALKPCSGIYRGNQVFRDDQDIRASLDLATKTTNVDTVIEFFRPGTEGNTATIQLIGDSGTNAGSTGGTLYAEVIHFKPAGTTVTQFEALIGGISMRVKTAGTGAHVLQVGDAFSATHLAGGLQAGRMLAGAVVLKGSGTTVNNLKLRDNWVDGARDQLFSDATGSAQWPEGYPLWSGNGGANVTNEINGGLLTWVTETTSRAETIASGALGVSKEMSFITTANTVAYTLADGIVDGAQHCIKIKSVSGSPAGTLTPAHMADGTTHTLTWTAAGGFACLSWDATGATYRLQTSSGVTLN